MDKVLEKIVSEISAAGVMPFRRFMELALYCPVYGYYDKEEDTIGRAGDFYTSVSVGPLFGELLAWQFADWLEGIDGPVDLIEAGAHRGDLARDILIWLRERRPRLLGRLRYGILEPSSRREQWQRQRLADFRGHIQWGPGFAELAARHGDGGFRGVIFANELLDALPVHCLVWDAGQQHWFERGVTLEHNRLTWARMAVPMDSFLPDQWHEMRQSLPDGYTIEVCPAATSWWAEAAAHLAMGRLLTLDYGLLGDELFRPERKDGTLRAYHRHTLNPDVLAHPGQQDITSHVNFSALQRQGESAGLSSDALVTQEQFLTGIAQKVWTEGSDFGEWSAARTRQFRTLTHPQFLGRAFRVLSQSRELRRPGVRS